MPVQSVNGIPIHYVVAGSGARTLCFVHGAGGSCFAWIRQLEELADVARVIALDLPGHGESGGDGCRKIGDYQAVVRGFVEALGLGKIVLAGHSMGGGIAQAFALDRPDLLAGLILIGTGARLRVLPRIFELLESNYPDGCAFVGRMGFSSSSRQGLKDGARDVMLQTRPHVTIGDFRACDMYDVMDRVGSITVPTLVIGGQVDELTPPKYAHYLVEKIAGARLLVLDAGHYVQLEQADLVNAAIREFLQTLDGTRGWQQTAVQE